MKRVGATVVLTLLLLGAAVVVQAGNWSWNAPAPLDPVTVTGIVAPAGADVVYGISGGTVVPLSPGAPAAGIVSTLGDSADVVNMTAGPKGEVYVVTASRVKSFNPADGTSAALDEQPVLPTNEGGGIIEGTYRYIAAGPGGSLIVIYQTTEGKQYLLKSLPPVVTEGVVVRIEPKTLNITSRGNWVTCYLRLPEGYDEADIDTAGVKITKIAVQGVGERAVDIFTALGAPSAAVTSPEKALMVKFLHYDRKSPANHQSLYWQLGDMLTGKGKGKYPTELTVAFRLKTTGEAFEGKGVFQAMKTK